MDTTDLSSAAPWIVGLNLLIALVGFYLTWHLWQLHQTLKGVADALLVSEQQLQTALKTKAPSATILAGRSGIAALRSHYGHLQHQLHQLQRLVGLTQLGLGIWHQGRSRWGRSAQGRGARHDSRDGT